jgi:hypothetical protein
LGQTLLTNFLKRRSGCTILLSGNWQEIYENAAGMGKAGNAWEDLRSSLATVGGSTNRPKIWMCTIPMLHGATEDTSEITGKAKTT